MKKKINKYSFERFRQIMNFHKKCIDTQYLVLNTYILFDRFFKINIYTT